MTRGEMRAAVLRNLGRSAATQTEQDDVDRWINQTMREDICADHNWSGMETLSTSETTTAGTGIKTWPSPTTFKDALWLQVLPDASSDYEDLEEVDESVALDRYQFSEQTSARDKPRVWARSGTSYLLRPIPDDTYTLRIKYLAYPAAITIGSGGDSSTNFILDYWSKLLEYGTTARGFLHYEEPEMVAQWTQLYRDELGKAISIDRRVQAPATLVLKPSMAAGKRTPGISGDRAWVTRIRGEYT